MRKLGAFIAFLVLAICAAGIFGMLHDQISYTVSNEYYTKFKFIQFDLLDLQLPDRVRAAMVGFLASWWMGVPLGVLTGVATSVMAFLRSGADRSRPHAAAERDPCWRRGGRRC